MIFTRVHWLLLYVGVIMQLFLPLLTFICTMMGLLTCKYEPFWHEVSVQSQYAGDRKGPWASCFWPSSYISLYSTHFSISMSKRPITVTCYEYMYTKAWLSPHGVSRTTFTWYIWMLENNGGHHMESNTQPVSFCVNSMLHNIFIFILEGWWPSTCNINRDAERITSAYCDLRC